MAKPCYENRGNGIELITNLKSYKADVRRRKKEGYKLASYLKEKILIFAAMW